MTKPDWEFWLSVRAVRVWQACALSLGIDPDAIKSHPNGWMAHPGRLGRILPSSLPPQSVQEAYSKRLRILSSHIGDNAHFRLHSIISGQPTECEIYLRDFANWAVNVVHWTDLPDELASLAHGSQSSAPAADRHPSAPKDWREAAREIADELFGRDTVAGSRDSLLGYSKRVMDEMQKRTIHGPRGRIDNPKTIMREALQGDQWWVSKTK